MSETTKPTIAERIEHLNPCKEAKRWAGEYTSPTKAWNECQRGDWMLWLVGRLSGPPESDERRKLVACAADCAELALPIFEKRQPNDDSVRKCIDACRAWSRNEISTEQLREARSAAAAYAAYAADAADAAACAAYAADAACAADAAYAADAADAAACAAYAAACAAIRKQTLLKCADIVRKHYPKAPRIRD